MTAHVARLSRRSLVAMVGAAAVTPVAIDLAAAQGTPGASPVASPVASPGAGSPAVSLVVAGLNNPRGMTFRADGTLLVAIGGNPGPNAAVVEVADGCPRVIAGGLPTARVAFRAIAGVSDVAVRDDRTYLLLAGGDASGGAPANGIYEIGADGTTTLVADISAFIRDNPVAEVPGDYDGDGQPYALAPDPGGDGFLVTEGNSNQVLRVSVMDGSVERVADLSVGHPIPTGLAVDAGGVAHVAYFTAAPYAEGTARVVQIMGNGSTTDVWGDLSLVIDLAIGPDGSLWALEMATGHGDDPSAIRPGTGRVVRRDEAGNTVEVAIGLELPSRMRFRPDGALLISGPAFGADTGEGWVIRLAPPAADAGAIKVPAIASLVGELACPT